MQGKEKILALGIALILFFLASNIVSQIFKTTDYSSMQANALYTAVTLVAIGLVAMLLGAFLIKVESISTGLMGGSVLILIYGGGWYYVLSQNQLEKTVLLAIVFIVLVAVGYLKFSKKGKSDSK
ncbi:MAG TPA: hypothetical protein VI977_04045 [archaeon]|nr:hypothetical protein [archaeon]